MKTALEIFGAYVALSCFVAPIFGALIRKPNSPTRGMRRATLSRFDEVPTNVE